MKDGRDIWYHEAIEQVDDECPPEEMNAEDPLLFFIPADQLVNQKVFYIQLVVIWSMHHIHMK